MGMYKKNGVSDPLQEKGITFTAAATAVTTPSNFTAPTGRGAILGLQVFVDDSTLSDLLAAKITIAANGINYFEDVCLAKFASVYQNSNNEFDFLVPEGGQATVSVNNGSSTAIVVAVNFLFRPPHYEA
jgi:hypothetical protein